MNEYEVAISKGRLRRVRTPDGARYFGLPIGSLITPKAIHNAMARVGDTEKVLAALEREDLNDRGAQGMMDRSEARRAANIKAIREKLAAKEKATVKIPAPRSASVGESIARARAEARKTRARTRRVSRTTILPGE